MLDHNCPNLVGNIGACIADVAIHLAHDTDVLVTVPRENWPTNQRSWILPVQQRVFLLARAAWSIRVSAIAGFVGLETGIGEDDDQSLRIFVGGRNWDMLFGDELGEGWRWERLGS